MIVLNQKTVNRRTAFDHSKTAIDIIRVNGIVLPIFSFSKEATWQGRGFRWQK